MKSYKVMLMAIALPAIVITLAALPQKEDAKKPFHQPEELKILKHLMKVRSMHEALAVDTTTFFPLAQRCGQCHGYDPTGFSQVTTSGVDVNTYDAWRSSMMANAAKDPFWRAKVNHESMVNPGHSAALQDKCTSCHAPSGHYQAKLHDGAMYYLFDQAISDTLGLDGVTCQACHAQSPQNLGNLHSGALHFDTNNIRVAYGPYPLAYGPPMIQQVAVTPKYGEHINDAGVCAGCHTLITSSVDLQGNFTGSTFTEQATYHEWLNSSYDKQHENVTCQGCHMPRLQDEIIIASGVQVLTPKSPYALHELAGGNVTMLKLMKTNRVALGIKAQPTHFDSTIAASLRMLQHKTLDLAIQPVVTWGDTAQFTLKLTNKAGHKFPSGYPSRRAWVEFKVTNSEGVTIFHSGQPATNGEAPDEDPNYEPHHQEIRNPNQVQIYELVPGDVNNNFTTILERAHTALKDNRLTPKGFSVNDPVYDTTFIAGSAFNDPDFNHDENGVEGTGSDLIHFFIPINGYSGAYTIQAKVWYQTVPMKWVLPMFNEFSSTYIDQFEAMYNAADHSPTLVSEITLASVPVAPVGTRDVAEVDQIKVYPTLSNNGQVFIQLPQGAQLNNVRIWNSAGKLVWNQPQTQCWLPAEKGIYWVEVQTRRGKKSFKVVRQ